MTPKEFNERFSYNKSTDRLGKGGFGTVFKAWDNANDCYVALKMQAVDCNFPSARLKAEVERAETLNHRNVAKYKECYTFEAMDGFMDVAVMSYYENGSLEDLIQSQQLNSEERASILRQMLEGIAYLHNHDIIHRDLKPQNILILHHGGRYTPKITDFGISKQLRDGESGSVSNSLPILSRPYASPEQFLGGTIKKNTDLWSFGVVAYRMFTGSLPFNTSEFDFNSITGRESFFNLLKSGQLPDAIATIPEPWQRLIRACLISSTELRPAHAEDCLQILDTFKETDPEPPVSPEPPEEEIYVAEVIETTPEDLATEPEPKPATEPEVKLNPEPKEKSNPKSTKPKTKRRSKWWLWLLWLLLLAIVGGGGFFARNAFGFYMVGDYYNEAGVEGVVFETSSFGRHGKIVSVDQLSLAWGPIDDSTQADSETNGKANTDAIMRCSDRDSYPAFTWCRGKGSNWYLPANSELQVISSNIYAINTTLRERGYTEISDRRYWSSTEYNVGHAWTFRMTDGRASNGTKYYGYCVRAVSAF